MLKLFHLKKNSFHKAGGDYEGLSFKQLLHFGEQINYLLNTTS